jgi:hypothetical protein
MADPTLLDRETILRAVRTWPPDEQRALAGEILRHAGVPPVEEPLVPPDSAGLADLLATGQAPPTDDEVARWLDERRVERYGR